MMHKPLVRPILEYASQVLCYRHYYLNSKIKQKRGCEKLDEHIEKLEAFQNKVLKKLIPCPKSTSPAVLRLFAGVMPISGRIEILKLRYFWKISHASDKNLAFSICMQKRKQIPRYKFGFIHEVFQLCCKLDCLDVWLKIRRPKENPLKTIRRVVVAHYLRKDITKSLTSTCMYNSLLLAHKTSHLKRYRLVPFFKRLGLFPDTIGRRHFIFALLDNCSFNRVCPKCGGLHMDIIQHSLTNCPNTTHLRLLLKYKLKLYNAPSEVTLTDKHQLFKLAIHGKSVFRKVLCEYLTDVGMY